MLFRVQDDPGKFLQTRKENMESVFHVGELEEVAAFPNDDFGVEADGGFFEDFAEDSGEGSFAFFQLATGRRRPEASLVAAWSPLEGEDLSVLLAKADGSLEIVRKILVWACIEHKFWAKMIL